MSGPRRNGDAVGRHKDATGRFARLRTCLVVVAVGLGAFVGAPMAAASTNFSWSGGDSEGLWSLGDDWSGGVAPSGSIGTLSFGDLGSACDNGTSSAACYSIDEDLQNVSVDRLDIADNEPYRLGGYALTLDGDSNGIGIGTAPAEPASAGGIPFVAALELGASQTWDLDSGAASPGGLEVDMVGASTNYSLNLQLGDTLYTTSVATADVSATGNGYLVLEDYPGPTRPSGEAQLPDTVLSQGAGLEVTAPGADSGSLSAGLGSPDDVSIGSGIAHDGTLAVTGNVTLGSQASLDFFIDQPESTTYPPVAGTPPTPSYDFSQLTASGTVDLGQANLNLYLGTSSTSDCRDLVPGQTYTLLSAGTITGELDDNGTPINQGQTVALQNDCNDANYAPTVAIYYDRGSTPETVTAQVVDGGHAADLPVLNGNPPSISDASPVVGSQLQASPGGWSETPTSYDYAWYSCSASADPDCDNMVGADAPSYTPTVADAGNTIEVCVSGANAYGSSTDEDCSDPTDPVSLPPPPTITGSEPSISGNGQAGDTLTASPGSWSGSPTFTYQWQRCATQGSNCTNISGATGSSYTLTSSDIGQFLRLEITATNVGGYTVVSLSSNGQVTGPTAQTPPTTLPTSTTPAPTTLPTSTAPAISSTQIRSALTALAHPSSKRTIDALVKTGLFKTDFHAPTGGSLRITWTAIITSGKGKHKNHKIFTVATGSTNTSRRATIKVTLHLTAVGKTFLKKNASGLATTATEKFKPSGQAWTSVTKKFSL
jgi:hypothetical protein